jgi:hypothetical protein
MPAIIRLMPTMAARLDEAVEFMRVDHPFQTGAMLIYQRQHAGRQNSHEIPR